MPAFIGIALALAVCVFARAVAFDRDRAFYPAVLIVTASYYVLFAVLGGSPGALTRELLIMGVFVAAAVAGFRRTLWVVVGGLAAHAVLDAVHGQAIVEAGAPAWWPLFCLTFDVTAAAGLAWLVSGARPRVRPSLRATEAGHA